MVLTRVTSDPRIFKCFPKITSLKTRFTKWITLILVWPCKTFPKDFISLISFENKMEWSIFTFYFKTWIIQPILKIPFIFKVLQTLLFVFLKMMAICTKIQYWEYLISNQILMAMTCYQYTPMIYLWIHHSTSHPPVLWDHLGVPTLWSWCIDINNCGC